MNARLVALSFLAGQVAIGSLSAHDNQEPKDAAEYQGCYKLTVSTWAPALNLGEDEEYITPPSAIELSVTPGTQGFEMQGFLVRPALGAKKSIHSAAYWHNAPKAHIEIVWTTGHSGLTMNLAIKGSTLVGTAKTFWDFGRKTQRAKVVGEKVACRASQ